MKSTTVSASFVTNNVVNLEGSGSMQKSSRSEELHDSSAVRYHRIICEINGGMCSLIQISD